MQLHDNVNTYESYENNDAKDSTDIVHAGFFVRLAAYAIDNILIGAILLLFRIPMWLVGLANPNNPLIQPVLFNFTTWDIIIYLLSAIYFIMLTYYKGATIGKYLLRIKVVSDVPGDKLPLINVIYRETIGRYLSSIVFVGYLLVAASKDKRGLHDMLSDTHVVYVDC